MMALIIAYWFIAGTAFGASSAETDSGKELFANLIFSIAWPLFIPIGLYLSKRRKGLRK